MLGILLGTVVALFFGAGALRVGRVMLERSADRSAAAEAARAAVDASQRAHPDWLVTQAATRLRRRIRPLELDRDRLMTGREAVQTSIDAQPSGPPLVRKLLEYASLALLPLLFLLSVLQLVPSFYTLSGSAPLSVVGGVLVAAIEVGIALALARVLYRSRLGSASLDEAASGGQAAASPGVPAGQQGRRAGGSLATRLLATADSQSGWSKDVLSGALTLAVAGVLVWGQYSWAPAHDLINLRGQLTVAANRYAQDQSNHAPQSLLTSDKQEVDTIAARLAAVRARDQALALIVPLGEDVAALPALGALGFAAEDLRRLSRRLRLARLDRRIGRFEADIEQARNDATLELQQALVVAGVDPALAAAPPRPAPLPPALPVPAQQALPGPTRPGQAAPPPTADTPAAPGPHSVDDLFPPAPTLPGTRPVVDTDSLDAPDSVWTDPL